jgi:EAL domain-containing protein (putative c-di-GMP-specific phosphodiesterase class I)
MRAAQAELPGNGRAAAITRAVVLLGKALGMSVVAGGVENTAQLGFLRAIQCDEVQGYLPARPAPYEQTLDWIATRMGTGGIPMLAPATNELLPSQSP